MKLLFIKDGYVDGQLVFEKGSTHEVSSETGSADRWIRRGIAVIAKEGLAPEAIEVNTDAEVEPTVDKIEEVDEAPVELEEDFICKPAKPNKRKLGGKKA